MDYKDTLNLPKTSFPMKASLANLEPKLLERWEKENIYQKILDHRRNNEPWLLHDGPPYANGHIHMGHALNKILKDIIIKSKAMRGYYSPYVPGWDCHGLPIEHQVDKTLGSKKAKMTQSEIRGYCRDYAKKFVDIQAEEFKRLGVFGQWDKPYLSMSFDYEAAIVRELGKVILADRLFQSPKPVLWCGQCRTALAEAEVEYENHTSPSIYVLFKVENDPAIVDKNLAGESLNLLIWTTTPWTIPSNTGIVFNPSFKYAVYRLQDNELIIIAKELSEKVWSELKLDYKPQEVLEVDNEVLPKLTYKHPFIDRVSGLAPAIYVTLEQGTGLVHTAPGHGRDDYETGLANNWPILSPLDVGARFTDEQPLWKGRHVLSANQDIMEHIKEHGALMGAGEISHSYPHCWRCHKPVVFRSTPQWFISLEHKNLRQQALKEIDEVKWIPKWGHDRIYGMVESRPDWCVSRQRLWGVPITIFLCKKCGNWHYNEDIMNHLYELFKEKGADVWFDNEPEQLMPSGQKCSHCGGTEFDKENDILDVWFDSGSSFAAVLEERDYLPNIANMYLEGSDQHRGWFHSSLLVSVANRDHAPYKEVLTHGYVVDGNGRKMSKSLGNTLMPEDIIKKYGADILRLWTAAENYQDDIRISNQIMDMLGKAYFHFRNSSRFILGNITDFDPEKNKISYENLRDIDKYILHQLNQLVEKTLKAYDNYEFYAIYHLINNFVVELSAFYHDVAKDCLYTLKADDPKRRGIQTVMYEVLTNMTRLMAPILSFTAEEIWSYLSESKKIESVFLTDMPTVKENYNQVSLANKWDFMLKIRSAVNKNLEEARRDKIIGAPLDAEVKLEAGGETYQLLELYKNDLPEIFITSGVKLIKNDSLELTSNQLQLDVMVQPSPHNKCPRCWVRHPDVDENQTTVCPKCKAALA